MKKWLVLAAITVLAVIVVACGSNSKGEPKGYLLEDLGEAKQEILITAKNYEFDQPEYKLKAGETVNLKLKSIDGVHGVKIANTRYSELKNNKTVAVHFTEPGTYHIFCSVPCGVGHTQMKAKIVVE